MNKSTVRDSRKAWSECAADRLFVTGLCRDFSARVGHPEGAQLPLHRAESVGAQLRAGQQPAVQRSDPDTRFSRCIEGRREWPATGAATAPAATRHGFVGPRRPAAQCRGVGAEARARQSERSIASPHLATFSGGQLAGASSCSSPHTRHCFSVCAFSCFVFLFVRLSCVRRGIGFV